MLQAGTLGCEMRVKPVLAEDRKPGRSKAARLRNRMRRLLGLTRLGRRAALLVEFAIVGPVFFLLLFFAFDAAYNLYLQGVLDTSLQATARDIQVGTQQPLSQTALRTLVCDNALTLLNCNDVFVRVDRVDPTSCPGGAGALDLYDATDGQLPQKGGALQLGLYGGAGNDAGPTECETSSSQSGFCVAGPSQYDSTSTTNPDASAEVIVLSAVYIAPSFLLGLSPFPLTYNGSIVKAQFSSSAFIAEPFSQTLPAGTNDAC
jgi:hypothetical protein